MFQLCSLIIHKGLICGYRNNYQYMFPALVLSVNVSRPLRIEHSSNTGNVRGEYYPILGKYGKTVGVSWGCHVCFPALYFLNKIGISSSAEYFMKNVRAVWILMKIKRLGGWR